jgi:hypothetical protein
MPMEIENLEQRPRIIIAKNQDKLMGIFNKFPNEEFTQHNLHEQTQIKYSASVHSALMALVKKGKIVRSETPSENGSRTKITYKKKCEDA